MVKYGNVYANEYILDKSYLKLVSTIAAFFGSLRFIWSFLLDKISYKKIYGLLICIQGGLIGVLPLVFQIGNMSLMKTLYLIIMCLYYLCEGGHYVLVPTIFAKLFGANAGVRIYGVAYSFAGLAAFVNIFLVDFFLDEHGWIAIGYSGFCFLYAILNAVALVILILIFKEEKLDFGY